MSERSSERDQVEGIVVASDRSPPVSPGLVSPPGHPNGQGSVRPHHSYDSVIPSQRHLNVGAIRDPRAESSNFSNASHAISFWTPLDEATATQQSMMAADQLNNEEIEEIRHGKIETHGKLSAQFLEDSDEMAYGNTSSPAGPRASRSANSLSPQAPSSMNNQGNSNYEQLMLSPTSMASFRDTMSPAESGDEDTGGVALATHSDRESSYCQVGQCSLDQCSARGVSLGAADVPPRASNFLGPELPGTPPYTPSNYHYSNSFNTTVTALVPSESSDIDMLCAEHNFDRQGGVTEVSNYQRGPSRSAMQAIDLADAAGLDSATSRLPNLNSQYGGISSFFSMSTHTINSTIGQYDQATTQRHLVDSYGNPLHANNLPSSHTPESVAAFNAIGVTGTTSELDLTHGHSQTSPDPELSIVESPDTIVSDTADDADIGNNNFPPAQDHGSIIPSLLQLYQQTSPISSQLLPGGFALQSNLDGTDVDPLDYMVDDFERNLDVSTLLEHWTISYGMKDLDFPPVGDQALRIKEWKRPDEVHTKDLDGDFCDPQGINWAKLGTTRENARIVRNKLYVNYTNIKHACPSEFAQDISESENYFRFRQTDTRKIACLSHFQLRNLLCATSKNDIYYAGRSKILCANRSLGTEQCIMDFTTSDLHSDYSGRMKVSTLAAGHGVLIAGGFGGEYALKSLSADYDSKHTEGLVTQHDNGITNHVHTIYDRTSGVPHAIFASNDCYIRILDCSTNTFIKEHKHRWAVNCTATSPDGRLRVVVGDTRHAYICNADTGKPMVKLRNHQDYGFACAWADDGLHVATGNQDATVQIWDARMWSHPLQIIASEIAGVRSLRFSPVGGGKRVLLMAEPADIVSVVDAESFQSKQRFDVFGEIGGISFSPDGSEFFVANTDRKFGGIMEYERIGYGEEYGMRYLRQREIEDAGDDYYDEKDFEWAADKTLDDDDRVATTGAHRSRRGLGLHSLHF